MKLSEFVEAFRSRLCLYHFTDIRNLPSIAENGLLSLSELRLRKVAVEAAGGNDWSQDSACQKGLDQYVNLCMRNSHPMEYVAKKEGRIGETKFLRVDFEILRTEGVRFTADVSNKAGVPLLTWEQACNSLDWEVLYTRTDWKDPSIQARLKQASKYEVLIPKIVPVKLIKNI